MCPYRFLKYGETSWSVLYYFLLFQAAKERQLALQLMSNNTTHRNTISVMTLATRVIERSDLLREITDLWSHLQTLRRQATAAITHAMQGA
jgi:hypothetical protein